MSWRQCCMFILIVWGTNMAAATPSQPISFQQLVRPDSPNYYLACVKDYCNIEADEAAPIFAKSVNELALDWQAVIDNEPRITVLIEDDEQYYYQYIQRVLIFYFPDYVTVKLIALDEQHSSIALLSYSKYGYYDFAVNKRRVQHLLRELKRRAAR